MAEINLEKVAFYLSAMLAVRTDVKPGVVIVLGSDRYAIIASDRKGASACHDVCGQKYEGEVPKSVDDLISLETVIGLSALSPKILSHLKDTGEFLMAGKNFVSYQRESRTYEVF